jgi:hypothetical protein
MPPTVNQHGNVLGTSPTFPSMSSAAPQSMHVYATGMVQCSPGGIPIPNQVTTAGTYYSTSPTYVYEQSSQPAGGWVQTAVVPVSCGGHLQGDRIVIATPSGTMMPTYYQQHQQSPTISMPSPPHTALMTSQQALMTSQQAMMTSQQAMMTSQQTSHPSLPMITYAPIQQTSYTVQQPQNMTGSVPALTNSVNMQVVWHSIFDQLFSTFLQVNNQWQLFPAMEAPTSGNVETIKDSAKVRFLCQDCGNAWTSMKGRIVFWSVLDVATGCGVVFFKLFGQQCEKCSSGKFEHAMWYPEEVTKVVKNVFHRVGELYYGFPKVQRVSDRRPGKPRTQHNSKLCQACADHVCTEAQ